MATRVAQHYAQVVGEQQQDGELHVNRIYADVLISNVPFIPILPGDADNVMSLTDVAAGFVDNQRVQDYIIPLTHQAIGVRDLPRSASNTLTLVSLGGRVRDYSGDNNLILSNIVAHFNLVDDRKPVGNVLGLSHEVTSLSSIKVVQDLELIQSLDIVFPIKPNIIQPLGLSQFVSTPHRAFISHTMNIVDSSKVPLSPQLVTHTLNLIDDVPRGVVDDVILFIQQVNFGFSQTVTQNLGITDLMHLHGDWVRSAEHSNFVGHALTWYEDTPCGRKQYTPFQGENTIPNLTTSPPSNVLRDPQGDTGNFSLYQPYLGTPTEEVVLRKPEMDNRDRNAYTRISEETRGGKLIVYADPDWPKVRTLAVTVVGLTEAQVDDLQDFMLSTVGEEIGITDWEGRLWKGFITNPNEPATQDGRSMWTISFEFQGEILDVEQPGNEDGNGMDMNITQAVTAVIV
jgi:hypothetical protein